MRSKSWNPRTRYAVVAALAVVLAPSLAACAAGGLSSTAGSAEAGEQSRYDTGGSAAAPEEAGSEADIGGGASNDADVATVEEAFVVPGGPSGRQVVTATLTVAVDDVPQAASQVRAVAVGAGGYVAAEQVSGGETPVAELVLRVPAADTAAVLTELAGLGAEVTRSSSSEDVEARLVDLDSRVLTQQASLARVRDLLGQAGSLQDVLVLEGELTRREADLESLLAQRAALADRAAMSTVTVLLSLPGDVVAAAAQVPPFLAGLQGGWQALLASTAVVLVVAGAVLPFAVVALVLLALSFGLVRLARRGSGGHRQRTVVDATP